MPRVGCAPGQRSARPGREAGIDPVCHTLVGAALARSGLGRRTAFGATALIVGANLPDLDALAYFAGPAADLEWRRGWSHGVLALALLPLLLTGCLLLLDRAGTAKPRQLLLLSFISILSHPILDTLNTYGVRWLMPFSHRWFYGDALFIIDPWLWLTLGLGVYCTARREKTKRPEPTRPARLALIWVMVYATLMAISGVAARLILRREVAPESAAIESIMAGPVPLTPLVREFVVEQQDQYLVGTFRWLTRPHTNRADILTYPRGWPSHPAAKLAAESPLGRRFLSWARFPTVTIQQVGPNSFVVHIVDLRYARRPGENFGTVSIPVTAGRREGGKAGRREGGKAGRREGGKAGRREGGKAGRG